MVLGFKTHFPNEWPFKGQPTGFKNKILAGVDKSLELIPKIHTIREGERWKPGMKIHMATGVRTANYKQFNQDYPELQTVVSVQKIIIHNDRDIGKDDLWIDGKKLDLPGMIMLAMNDGFNSTDEFFQWFTGHFEGQLIHWTNFKY